MFATFRLAPVPLQPGVCHRGRAGHRLRFLRCPRGRRFGEICRPVGVDSHPSIPVREHMRSAWGPLQGIYLVVKSLKPVTSILRRSLQDVKERFLNTGLSFRRNDASKIFT